jgi:hypothetical protein
MIYATQMLHARIEAAVQGSSRWASEAVFVPRMYTYDQVHYERKKAAMKMYRSQVSAIVCMYVCM